MDSTVTLRSYRIKDVIGRILGRDWTDWKPKVHDDLRHMERWMWRIDDDSNHVYGR